MFRRIDGDCKIDWNKMTGLERAEAFLDKGGWGRMFRDQGRMMNEAVNGMKKGRLNTAQELKAFIDRKIAAMIEKYERENRSTTSDK